MPPRPDPLRSAAPPVVLFAFANSRQDLRYLPEEQRRVRAALTVAEQLGLCEIVERANATAAEVLDVFQDARYRNRVAIFHFSGHAGSGELLFESQEAGVPRLAHARGLARFLGEQRGLALIFLNGCSTQGQVQALLDAGVPAVIATYEAILDSVAAELSARFYQTLASGDPLGSAFAEATAAVQAQAGELPEGTYDNLHPVPLVLVQERWPWELHVAPGAEEEVRRWSLPRAARDPLFGLPPLPAMDLPLSPFKHLSPFTREDAPVFFGRGRDIRALYEEVTRPDGAPIVLLFGASGAGKSSLLAAGLLPRLVASHEVLYLRRDPALGLAGTLARALGDEDGNAGNVAWHRKETPDRPLVVILDQAEEAWTRPLAPGGEVQDFAATLRTLFASRESRPRGRLVLGFRKEWLAEVRQLLDDEKLPRALVEILHLDRDGIEEAVRGPASSERLRRQYGLEVAAELPARIACDLLEQGSGTIAPILQILLAQMWTESGGGIVASPRFTLDLYESLKRRGLLLDDFLDEQFRALREWRPEAVSSGLVLDLLFFHTTDLGTAESRAAAAVAERYGHRPEIPELLGHCKDRYLLAEGGQEGEARQSHPSTTRLAHDTLAPLVRRRFESSDLPGQRAQRILLRAEEWREGRIGEVLGELDLARVEEGRDGMRERTEDEARLVAASRHQVERRRHQSRLLKLTAVAAVVVIFGAALLFRWQRQQARASEERAQTSEGRARDRAYAALGTNLEVDHPTEAALVVLEVRRPDSTPAADVCSTKLWRSRRRSPP